jgi:hypothetical protein
VRRSFSDRKSLYSDGKVTASKRQVLQTMSIADARHCAGFPTHFGGANRVIDRPALPL